MSASFACTSKTAPCVLRYQSLSDEQRVLLFPCDAEGRVPMDDLSRATLNNYLFARAMVGFEFAAPRVLPRGLH
jgi:hypothetical protein